MDISTVIGLVVCIGAVLGTILTASGLGAFIDVPSLLTVIFGMVVPHLLRPLECVLSIPTYFLKAIFFSPADPKSTIDEIGNLAETARRESIFALKRFL